MPNIEIIWYISNDEAGHKNVEAEHLHVHVYSDDIHSEHDYDY